MQKLLINIIVLVALGAFQSGTAFSQSSLGIGEGISLSFNTLRDVGVSADISDICCDQELYQFSAKQTNMVRSRYGEPSMWLKFTGVQNTGIIQLSPILDAATLYVRSVSGTWREVKTGDSIPRSETTFPSPLMALPLSGDGKPVDFYIRIVQPTAVTIDAKLWSLDAFLEMQNRDRTIKMFLLGGVCAVILYNIFVSFLVRNQVFLANAFSVMFILLFSLYLSGYGQFYLWAEHPNWSNPILVISMFGAMVFGSTFMWLFISREDENRFSGWYFFLPPVVGAIATILLLIAPYWIPQLLAILSGVLAISIYAVAVTAHAWMGNRNAIILIPAILLAIGPGFGLSAIDKIFGIDLTLFGNNNFEVALFCEAIFFSLALASKMRRIELDTQTAHEDIIKLRNENTSRMIVGQDIERKRVAGELHDGVGQDFLLVLGNLKNLEEPARASGHEKTYDNALNSAETALDNLRGISREMYPSSIEHLGLEDALSGALKSTAATYKIDTSIEFDFSQTSFSPEWQLHIYRIIQSSASNLVHHSQATYCRAYTEIQGSEIKIVLEDNGIGMEPSKMGVGHVPGLGLTSIQERVRLMGGRWQMHDSELGGMITEFWIPRDTPIQANIDQGGVG